MMKRTHLLAGMAVTLPFISWDNVILLPVAVLGSVAADWDYFLGIEHRTSTHSLLAVAVSSFALGLLNIQLGALWAINYIIHLILDSLTMKGVPLYYPWDKKCYGIKLFKTRGAEDGLILLIALYVVLTFF